MPKRRSKIGKSLKELGDIQVNEWDLMGLLNKDIRDLHVAKSLRKLGNIRVMEWDFKDALPAVRKTANMEVDLADIFRRAAHYKVMEWDFRKPFQGGNPAHQHGSSSPVISKDELRALIDRLKNFLQFLAVSLIDEPAHAQIKVAVLRENVVRLRLVMVNRDVSRLIGREGHTAAAMRNVLKGVAGAHGVHVLLEIHSHAREMELIAAEEARKWALLPE